MNPDAIDNKKQIKDLIVDFSKHSISKIFVSPSHSLYKTL